MTVYYDTLILTELNNTNPPAGVVLNLTTSDSIVLTIDTLDPGDGNNWARVSTPVGCTTSSTSGANGTTTTITPTVGATTYYVIFRTSTESGFYYGKISGNVTSGNPDTTPDQFTFTDETNVPLSSVRTSTITISGIDTATNISITGGEYSLNGGSTWTSNSGTGTISNGQQIIVRHTSSGSYSTATNTTLTVGGISDTFTSTTLAADTTPDAFTFTDETNVPLSSVRTSTITISGINSATNISITGGEYSLNGGTTWTSSSGTGTISNGQQIIVRHTSSASYNTAVNTVLTVGGVSDTFTSTTAAAVPTYSASNASINEGASGSVTVTTTNVANGTTLYWTVDASAADVSTLSGSFTINSNSGSFSISPIADFITEGVETYTISIRTGSISGSIVAESTLTINDTSVSSGGQYGLQVFNSSGNMIVDVSSRLPRFVMSGLTSSLANGASTNITVTGMQNTDNWLVFAIDSDVNRSSYSSYVLTKNNGSFTITNNVGSSASFYYWVFRS